MALRRNRENAFMRLIVPSHSLDPERLLLRRRDGPARAGLRSFLTSGGGGLVGGRGGRMRRSTKTMHSRASVAIVERVNRVVRVRDAEHLLKTYGAPKIQRTRELPKGSSASADVHARSEGARRYGTCAPLASRVALA